MNDILELATEFEKLAQMGKSLQPGEARRILQKASLIGSNSDGSEDPDENDESFNVNSKVADKVFKIIDKYAPADGSFKVAAKIGIDPKLGVSIAASAPSSAKNISADLSRVFGPAMSTALKRAKKGAPATAIAVPWFSNVGY